MEKRDNVESKHNTLEQVIRGVAEGDEMLNKGAAFFEVACLLGVTRSTSYRWKNTCDGMKATEARWLKDLEAENEHLEKSSPGVRIL